MIPIIPGIRNKKHYAKTAYTSSLAKFLTCISYIIHISMNAVTSRKLNKVTKTLNKLY